MYLLPQVAQCRCGCQGGRVGLRRQLETVLVLRLVVLVDEAHGCGLLLVVAGAADVQHRCGHKREKIPQHSPVCCVFVFIGGIMLAYVCSPRARVSPKGNV